jgi:hypothetical protein
MGRIGRLFGRSQQGTVSLSRPEAIAIPEIPANLDQINRIKTVIAKEKRISIDDVTPDLALGREAANITTILCFTEGVTLFGDTKMTVRDLLAQFPK